MGGTINLPIKPGVSTALNMVVLGLGIIHLLNKILYFGEIVDNGCALISIAVILLILPTITGKIKYVVYAIYLAGAVLLFYSGASLAVWLDAFKTNLDLITIVIFAPLLGLAIEKGNYLGSLRHIFRQYIRNGASLYLLNTLLSFGLSLVLNIGSLPIINAIMPFKRAGNYELKRLMITSVTRSFVCSFLISPNFAAVGLIVWNLKLSWTEVATMGIVLALVILATSCLFEMKKGKKIDIEFDDRDRQEYYSTKKIMEIAFFVLFSLLSVVLVQLFTSWSILTIVPVVAIILSFVWVLYTRRSITAYIKSIAEFTKFSLTGVRSIIVLFIGAGFLAAGIKTSSLGIYLPRLVSVAGGNSTLLTLLVIMAPIVLLALVGVDTMVSITVLSTVLIPGLLGITPLAMGMALLGACALGVLTSPFSGYNLLFASLSEESPVKISLLWNYLFTLTGLIVVALLITLFNGIFTAAQIK